MVEKLPNLSQIPRVTSRGQWTVDYNSKIYKLILPFVGFVWIIIGLFKVTFFSIILIYKFDNFDFYNLGDTLN